MVIKNIIFDLGGVILNLDQDRTLKAFEKLGADLAAYNEKLSIFKDFETGKIDAATFTRVLHQELNGKASTQQIEEAWNKMLLNLPSERVDYVRQLKQRYRLILLSNTNTLHIDEVYRIYGKEIFEDLFEDIYLSHEIGLRKPDVACYQYVINHSHLKASETVFVDDSKVNLSGAQAAGLSTIWAHEPLDLWFEQELKGLEYLQMN